MIDKYNPENLTNAQLWMLALSSPLTESNQRRHDLLCFGNTDIESSKHMLKRDYDITKREELVDYLPQLLNRSNHSRFAKETNFISSLSEEGQKKYINSLPQNCEEYTELTLAKEYYYSLAPGRLFSWDCCRYVYLCRTGVFTKLLSENEGWNLMKRAAVLAKKSYSSWRDFGIAYFAGRQYWQSLLSKDYADKQLLIIKRLITDKNSPWNKLVWDTKLD